MKKKTQNKAKKKEEAQLNLGFKNSFLNKFYKWKGDFQLKLAYFETKRFVRSPMTWVYITLTSLFIAIQGYLIQQVIDKLPSKIPLFTYILNSAEKLVSRDYILIIPGISLLSAIISIYFANRFYHQEKHMSGFIMLSMVLLPVLLTILLFRIIAPYYG